MKKSQKRIRKTVDFFFGIIYNITKDGAFVQVGTYWYEVQELTKSIEAIKEAIEEAENEEA